jgi:hypothetical protein
MSKWYRYARAEASRLVHGDVPDKEYQSRIDACRGCDQLKPGKPVGWCKACGCGQRRRAELSIKAKMPAAACPLNKW